MRMIFVGEMFGKSYNFFLETIYSFLLLKDPKSQAWPLVVLWWGFQRFKRGEVNSRIVKTLENGFGDCFGNPHQLIMDAISYPWLDHGELMLKLVEFRFSERKGYLEYLSKMDEFYIVEQVASHYGISHPVLPLIHNEYDRMESLVVDRRYRSGFKSALGELGREYMARFDFEGMPRYLLPTVTHFDCLSHL